MRRILLAVTFLAAAFPALAQSVSVYQTTPDLHQALAEQPGLRFSANSPSVEAPAITIDDSQRFQQIDGFGASLTDAAAWLFAKKLTPSETDAAFKLLFGRKKGIAINFLRQPMGSSDLAVTFYSFDDLCQQILPGLHHAARLDGPNSQTLFAGPRSGVHSAAAEKSAVRQSRDSCDADAVESTGLDEVVRHDVGLERGYKAALQPAPGSLSGLCRLSCEDDSGLPGGWIACLRAQRRRTSRCLRRPRTAECRCWPTEQAAFFGERLPRRWPPRA